MKKSLITICASALPLLQILLCPPAMPADLEAGSTDLSTISFKSLQTTSIGSLSLAKGFTTIKGNSIDVSCVPENLFDPRIVLSGVLLNPVAVPARNPIAIKAIAYFFAGGWVPAMSQLLSVETVVLKSGKTVSGRLIGGSDKTLVLKNSAGEEESIEIVDVENIQSPNAYRVLIPVTSSQTNTQPVMVADSIRFQSSTGRIQKPQISASKPLGIEPGVSRKTIAAYLFADTVSTIAPAVVAPLVLGRSLSRPLNQLKQYNTLNALSSIPATPSK